MRNANSVTGWTRDTTIEAKKLVVMAIVTLISLSALGQTFWEGVSAATDAIREHSEQSQADASIRALFAKAKSAEEDGNVNLCGFYTGMPKDDMVALANHYGLSAQGEVFWAENLETHEIYSLRFTLQGVRRITKGGNSFEELAQAVANRVGTLQHKGGWDGPKWYEYKTIDGVTLKMDERNGCTLYDEPRAQIAEELARCAKRLAEEKRRADELARHMAEIPAINEKLRAGGLHQAGETKTITLPGGAGMEMVWCPPGAFLMGSPKEERRSSDETQYGVTLTKGFWMAKTEVTQKQWKNVMKNNPSNHKGDDLPVENVSWNDCQEFCQKAGLALPTEAEWEYACRSGSTGAYGGTGKLDDMGWYYGNSGNKTHLVGQKSPNTWGLCDMHGNVWEWCQDWCGGYSGGAVTNPIGAGSGGDRVLRGGSCRYFASYCRSAYRDWSLPGTRDDDIGFRPVVRQ